MFKKIFVTLSVAAIMLVAVSCAKQTPMQNNSEIDAAKLITEVKTTQYFTEDKVPEEDLNKILAAGVNAPSAMNTQPWHFTAITDAEVAKALADAMGSMKPPAGFEDRKPEDMSEMPVAKPEGKPDFSEGAPDMPMAPEGAPAGAPVGGFFQGTKKAGIGDAPVTIVISCTQGSELSAGLAVQNMAVEAQLLGYGTKIMTAPTMALNTDEYKSMLNVPDGQKIVAVLIVGKPATAEENPDAVASATTRNAFEDVVTIIE